jgi:protein ImuB
LAKTKLQGPTFNAQDRSIAEILGIFHKWGIHTLGQLTALNIEELRNRLGNEAARLWERANGTATRPLKFVQPPETFAESFEFDHEIETAEPLLFILRRFLEQLSLRLSSIYLVARELTLTITFSGEQTNASATPVRLGPRTYERVFKIPQPTNDVDLLFRMLQTYLENFKSEHSIVAVALSAEPIRPVSHQFGLFETALRNPQQLYETLARLSALLGNDRVGTPVLEETHRPDAFRMEPFSWGAATGLWPVRTPSCAERTAHRAVATTPALRRFRPPARTSIFISKHRHLQSDKVRGQIIDQIGPFLLSGNWWDEKAWTRAEWDMQLENGEIVRAHESEGAWKLDGLYD